MSAPPTPALSFDLHGAPPEELVQWLIQYAIDTTASDLFLATNEDHVALAFRHLGILQPVGVIPLDHGRRCIAHLKAVSGIDLMERHLPLDGRRIHPLGAGKHVDLRINIIPTLYGEDVAVRILERDTRLLSLESLGLLPRDYNQLLSLLNSPSGLLLVTGPTGSGKTTTLYACLAHLNNGQRKINTIEDPIEYALPGVRQSQVWEGGKVKVDFPDLLRSVLRQAPDAIMIGEVRDPLTAAVAVRAAGSGLLVLATLHAPTAAGAVQSMLNLGVERRFLAAALRGAVAQRLVRTLCPDCKVSYDLSLAPHTFDDVRRWLEPGQGQVLYGPGACDRCRRLGYGGRTGVFEVLAVSAAIRRLVESPAPSTASIRDKAVADGMIEFGKSALLKVAQGQTSIEEVVRALPLEELGTEG